MQFIFKIRRLQYSREADVIVVMQVVIVAEVVAVHAIVEHEVLGRVLAGAGGYAVSGPEGRPRDSPACRPAQPGTVDMDTRDIISL